MSDCCNAAAGPPSGRRRSQWCRPGPRPHVATMKVLLVRHGHSQMNDWQEDTFSHFDGTPPSEEKLEWMKGLAVADDHLTSKGQQQAAAFTAAYAPALAAIREAAGGRASALQIHCSIQNRPLETCFGIADATATPIVVRPDLHEIGASGPPVPGMVELAQHMEEAATDRIMKTAADLRAQHPLIDTGGIPQHGPVLENGSMMAAVTDPSGAHFPEIPSTEMYETGASVVQGPSGKLMALVSARVRVVAAWLKSVELHESVGEDGIIVVVSHGAFLGMLIAELIGESKSKSKSN